MKQKRRITESDYIKAVKKADRELEIAMHGKQISMRGGILHINKKKYNRAKEKKRIK